MKFNWTIFAVPCALAGFAALTTIACTVTSEITPVGDGGVVARTDGGDASVDCEANAATFSNALVEEDGGAQSSTEKAACKACLKATANCSSVAAIDTGLMQCIAACISINPDAAGDCIQDCGADTRYATNYNANYPAFETALLDRCPTQCQITATDGTDGGTDGH